MNAVFFVKKNLRINVLPLSEREFLLKNNPLTSRDKNGNWDVINTATVVSDRLVIHLESE